jgi:hypothetical protein
MNDQGDPNRPEGGPGSMDSTEKQRYLLEQQVMEARLEIIRGHRHQREAQFSRVINFVFVFVAAGLVAFVLDAKGCRPIVSIGGSVAVIVVVGAWWAYRKPY